MVEQDRVQPSSSLRRDDPLRMQAFILFYVEKANEVSLIADSKYIHKLYTLTAVCVLAVEQVFARSGSSISQV